MNRKGYGRKRSWPNLIYHPGIYLDGLTKITKTSGEPGSEPRFKPRISRIRSRNANHSTQRSIFGMLKQNKNITNMGISDSDELQALYRSSDETVFIRGSMWKEEHFQHQSDRHQRWRLSFWRFCASTFTHPHLVPRLRMSRSYTSSPPTRLHGV
jgi:hypothetical protein